MRPSVPQPIVAFGGDDKNEGNVRLPILRDKAMIWPGKRVTGRSFMADSSAAAREKFQSGL